uniref:Transmembrane protein 209 n=1 Tax=Cacopsylla melanoneura TaxID=428564 RepID=A0A8D8WXA1_9HEMI
MSSPQRADINNQRVWNLITKRMENETKYKNALVWGTVNLGFFSVLAYDIYYSCPFYSWPLYLIEILFTILLFLCSVYNLGQYLRLNHFTNPIELTAQQFKLFGICRQDPNFKLKYVSTPFVSPDVTPLNMSSNSWLSSSFVCSYPNNANESGMSSPPGGGGGLDLSKSLDYDELDPIDSESSYREYRGNRSLTIDYSPVTTGSGKFNNLAGEKANTLESSLFRSFWSNPDAKGFTSILKTGASVLYQTSPVLSNKTLSDSDNQSRTYLEDEVWKKLKINPYNLTQWSNNLKLWFHRTILVRLVKEMDAVNARLLSLNMPDIQIGSVGLDRLRQSAAPFNIPSLSLLVQFLSLTPHQEYLVQRIRELSRNWYLSEYHWNGGGSNWESHYPTDAKLFLHLLVTYFDTLVPTFGSQGADGLTSFSSRHITQGPHRNKPPSPSSTISGGGGGYSESSASAQPSVGIHEASVLPPHYTLTVPPHHVYEIPKGRNNLFETILAFLHYVKTKEHGVLGKLNLGPGGTNMLWILEDGGSSPTERKC